MNPFDKLRQYLHESSPDYFTGKAGVPTKYPVADAMQKVMFLPYKPISNEEANDPIIKAYLGESLDPLSGHGGGGLAGGGLMGKMGKISEEAETASRLKALDKIKGVYVRPYEAGGDVVKGYEKHADLINAPNKALAEYRSLDYPEKGLASFDDAGKKLDPQDIEPMVVGHDRGNYTELVPPYTPLNKNWAWGSKEQRAKNAGVPYEEFVDALKKNK